MKDSIFIDSGLPVNFWAEAMDTANYLYNCPPIKQDSLTIILKETWTNVRQNLEYMRIFRSKISTFIPTQKCWKLDVQKP